VSSEEERPDPEVRTAFAGRRLRVEEQIWPGGVRREVARVPGACAAVVLTGDDHVVLVEQRREAIGRALLEAPAGIYDVDGEGPEDAIRREIREETGYRAGRVDRLGRFYSSPGFTDEAIDLLLSWAEPGGPPEEPGIAVVVRPFAEVVASVEANEIEDAHTALAVLLAARRLASEDGP